MRVWPCDVWSAVPFIISTHTPVRVWLAQHHAVIVPDDFNSHTREGVTKRSVECVYTFYFNSHTREGVTKSLCLMNITARISTHTPVRVWPKNRRNVIYGTWFQLTHPWGCDIKSGAERKRISISTHTPVRVWPGNVIDSVILTISTHTPVRVWLSYLSGIICTAKFQLTHPWGCDSSNKTKTINILTFQLTHPWGCD